MAGFALGIRIVHPGTVNVRFVDQQTFADAIDWQARQDRLHVTLRYRLEANGRLITNGQESVSDLGFAGRIDPRWTDNLR